MLRYIFCFLLLSLNLSFSLLTRAQDRLGYLFRKADSLGIQNRLEVIKICDSVLSLKQIPDTTAGGFYRIRGSAHYFNGDYDKAGTDFATAVRLLEKTGPNTELGITLIEQAKLYRKMTMFPQAIETYRRAGNIFEQLGEKNHLASVLNEWGVVYEMMEDYPQAIRFYQSSLQLKEELQDTTGIAYSNSFLANVYMLQNDLGPAEDYARKAFGLFRYSKNFLGMAFQSADMALILEKKKQYAAAIQYLEYSDSIGLQMSYPDLLSENARRKADIYAAKGDYANAYKAYRKHSMLRDSLFTAASQKTIAELNIQYNTSEKDKQILIQENRLLQQRWWLFVSVLLLMGAAAIVLFIQRNKKLKEQQLQQQAEHKEKMLRLEALNALQQDRLRISRDLHDNIGAYLTFIRESINSGIPEPDILKQIAQESITELRRTVWLINKSSVSIEEWVIKLKEYHASFKNISIDTVLADPDILLSAVQATGMFRIIQEAVNNALKHSGAGSIHIDIREADGYVHIEIKDNGKGFDAEKADKGFGLNNMQQRATELNGSYKIESQAGKGTKVTVRIPVQP